ncbi:hypothetical protein V6N11_063546 [Hibiscus sabdariffa]|uniref:FH2 domain-containing protein n=1 Tax=Hibiscus sabdariffa TaxID=183260 RepID=A0ABR1ZG56_9ROSI
MKGLKVYVIFMLVLVFAAGKEGVEAKTCTGQAHLARACVDDICNQVCLRIHEDHDPNAKGACVVDKGSLVCELGSKGDINDLGSAEKFVKVPLSVPFECLHAKAMLYRETFDDEVIHLKSSCSMLELLEAVLKTGNRMNVGTIRGGARVLKLDPFLKLADVKGTDGKTTLLHFIVQEIVRSEGIRVSDSIVGKINQRN